MCDGVMAHAFTTNANNHLFSMTSEYRPEVFKKFGYDACYRINQPEFFVEVSKVFGVHLHTLLFDVTYIDKRKRFHSQENIPASFVKDLSFSDQREVRAVWEQPDDGSRREDEELASWLFRQNYNKFAREIGNDPDFILAMQEKAFKEKLDREHNSLSALVIDVPEARRFCSPMP